MHTVFRLEAFPEIGGAVYVAARRVSRSRCEAVAVGQVLPVVGLNLHSGLLRRLAQLGADEIHLHLLARTPAETAAIVGDLRRRHVARQPVAA